MKILFDTNVVLDVLLNRQPHAAVAARLFVHVEHKRIEGMLGATTVTTIYYLAERAVGTTQARGHIHRLLSLFDIAPAGRVTLSDALFLSFKDYEDAVLHETGRHTGAVGIVTRNANDFVQSTLRVYAPDELLRIAAVLPQSE